MNRKKINWHQMASEDVLHTLHSDASSGISRKTAHIRYAKEGANTLFDCRTGGLWRKWKPFLSDPLFLLLGFSCLFSLLPGAWWEGIPTAVVFALGCILCAVFVRREEKAERALADRRIPRVCVIRDGIRMCISARRVVRGDVILLSANDVIPCDCRLIGADHLSVKTLTPGEGEEGLWMESSKDADFVYPYGSAEHAPNYCNLLYGGSIVTAGNAVAVAVETGAYTYLGSMTGFSFPEEAHFSRESRLWQILSKPVRRYRILFLILFVPVLWIGLLTARESNGLLRLFLPMCACLGAASTPLLRLFVTLPQSFLRRRAERNGTAVFGTETVERLAGVSDLYCTDLTAVSDGTLHLYRAADCRGELSLSERDRDASSLRSVCEALAILDLANRRLPSVWGTAVQPYAAATGELIRKIGFDTEALNVRLQRIEWAENTPHIQRLNVQMREDRFGLRISGDRSAMNQCFTYEDGATVCAITPEGRIFLDSFRASAEREGATVLSVFRRREGREFLIGLIALREAVQPDFSSLISRFSEQNVRVSFFLSAPDFRTIGVLRALGVDPERDICRPSSEYPNLLSARNRFRFFAGWSDKDVCDIARTLSKQGHRIAVLNGSAPGASLLDCGDLSVSVGERAGEFNRRKCDVLLPSYDAGAGGLSDAHSLICKCRAAEEKSRSTVRYLFFSHLLRFLLFPLCLLFGRGLPTALAAMFLCYVADPLAVYLIANAKEDGEAPLPVSPQKTLRQLFCKSGILPVLIPCALVVLTAFVLGVSGLSDAFGCTSFVSASAVLIQYLLFLLVRRWEGGRMEAGELLFSFAVFCGPPLLLSVLSPLLPSVANAAGFGGWILPSACLLVVSPLLLLVLFRLLPRFFGRTAK